MKRFIETNDWRDPAFRKLSPKAKHLRRYLWDNCDCAGVIAIDLEAVIFHVGEPINEKHITELGSWLQVLPNGKYLIPSFIHFQCGELRESCPAHKPVIASVGFHGLTRNGITYTHTDRLPDSLLDRQQEKEKEPDKEKEKDNKLEVSKSKASQDDLKVFCLSVGLALEDGDWLFDKWEGNGWKNDGKAIKDWMATIRAWKASGIFPSQKQSGNGHVTGADKIIIQKEYDRIEERLKTLRHNYGDHQTWTEKDRAELVKLKERRKELMGHLGVMI